MLTAPSPVSLAEVYILDRLEANESSKSGDGVVLFQSTKIAMSPTHYESRMCRCLIPYALYLQVKCFEKVDGVS